VKQTHEPSQMDEEQGPSVVVVSPKEIDTVVTEFTDFTRPADVPSVEDPSSWTRVTRQTATHKKKDGNETDSSTSSRISLKSASKKMRCDKSNNTHDQEPIL
jgi:hypothetical protein